MFGRAAWEAAAVRLWLRWMVSLGFNISVIFGIVRVLETPLMDWAEGVGMADHLAGEIIHFLSRS